MPLNELYVPAPRAGKWFIDAHATAAAKGYDPSQPRDNEGRWSSGGGSMAPDQDTGGGTAAEAIDVESLRGLLEPNEFGALGTKDIGAVKAIGYRVGPVDNARKRGVFFAGSTDGLASYATLHEGHEIKRYEVSLKNTLLAGHQNDVTKKLLGKTYADAHHAAGGGVEGGVKLDQKIARAAVKAGYDGIIYLRPAAPAKTEIAVFKGKFKEVSEDGDKGYDPNQPRDEYGRWSSGGSGGPEVGDDWLDPKPPETVTAKDTAALANWETHDRLMHHLHVQRWDVVIGPKLEEAKHLDEIVRVLKAKESKVTQKMNKSRQLASQLGELENRKWAMDWSSADPAELQELDTKITELAAEHEKAFQAWKSADASKNDRMIKAVREHIQEHLKENLDIGAPVEMRVLESGKYEPVVNKAQDLLRGCITEKVSSQHTTAHVMHTEANDENGGTRAYHNQVRNPQTMAFISSTLNLPDNTDYPTVIHEFGHAVEVEQRVSDAAHAFLAHRVGREKPVPLHIEQPGRGYKEGELGRKDDFEKVFGSNGSYVGKFYSSGSTEIMSMGMEKLFSNPVEFAKKDPEYFKFVVGVLDGSLI